jgi:hypothetical protein
MKIGPALLLTTVTLLFTPLLSAQATYTTGFEPPQFTLGDVNGQNGWGHLDNSPTGGFIEPVPAGSPAQFGTQSLAIRTRNDFFGVANRLYSPTISPAAGETGSKAEGVVVPNPQRVFSASLWFHMPATPVISTPRTDGRFAELNPSTKGAPDAPANRYAQVRLINDTNTAAGRVRVEIGWYTSAGFVVATVATVDWNQWIRFDYLIELVDGFNGAEPNDRFTLSLFDLAGTPLGSACGSTWELPYTSGSFGGGTGPRAINGFDFWSTSGPTGALAGHLDNLTMTATTPAGTLGVAITGSATTCFGATTLLTANATTGAAPISTYAWRNAANQLVGSGSTFAAGAGTYTVTVTDALCGTATSSAFAVTQLAQLAVSISGASSVPTFGATTPLTANVTGGSGSIGSYTWRDAANQIVGSGSMFTAGAGTYTVTVTDATCGIATSAPFSITQPPPTPVPTASDAALLLLIAAMAGIALMRMTR